MLLECLSSVSIDYIGGKSRRKVLSREFLVALRIVDEIDPVLSAAEPVLILRGGVMIFLLTVTSSDTGSPHTAHKDLNLAIINASRISEFCNFGIAY